METLSSTLGHLSTAIVAHGPVTACLAITARSAFSRGYCWNFNDARNVNFSSRSHCGADTPTTVIVVAIAGGGAVVWRPLNEPARVAVAGWVNFTVFCWLLINVDHLNWSTSHVSPSIPVCCRVCVRVCVSPIKEPKLELKLPSSWHQMWAAGPLCGDLAIYS